jgi:hypothetical protein
MFTNYNTQLVLYRIKARTFRALDLKGLQSNVLTKLTNFINT